jgi:hypothetical protein
VPDLAVISNLEPKEINSEKEKEKERGTRNRGTNRNRKVNPESAKALQRKVLYESTKWPVVEFEHGIRAMLGPVEFTSETTRGIVQAKRLQVSRLSQRLIFGF